MGILSSNWMVNRVNAAFQSLSGIVHFLLILAVDPLGLRLSTYSPKIQCYVCNEIYRQRRSVFSHSLGQLLSDANVRFSAGRLRTVTQNLDFSSLEP